MIDNSSEQIKIRKARDTLRIVGMGTIGFSLWTVLKCAGVIFFRKEEIMEKLRSTDAVVKGEYTAEYFFTIMLLAVAVYLLVEISFRLFVGISAIREGKGKRSFFIYIIVALLLIYGSFSTIVLAVLGWVSGGEGDQGILSMIADSSSPDAVIIEITSMIMMIEMVAAAIRLRKHGRRLKKKEAGANAA